MSIDANRLHGLTGRELDELFTQSPAGRIPDGATSGEALTGTRSRALSTAAAWLVASLAWKGKVFDRSRGELVNRVSPFGLRFVRAKVYKEGSWVDGKEAIVLDYAHTSLLARSVRDEIREVAPGLYLGVVFWHRRKVLRFSLRTSEAVSPAPTSD